MGSRRARMPRPIRPADAASARRGLASQPQRPVSANARDLPSSCISSTPTDMRRFDPSLEPFSDSGIGGAQVALHRFRQAFPRSGSSLFDRPTAGVAEGELIVLPYLPSELLALSEDEAVDLVQSAVDLAVERGAEVVGLARLQLDHYPRRAGVAGARRRERDQRQQLHRLDRGAGARGCLRRARISL